MYRLVFFVFLFVNIISGTIAQRPDAPEFGQTGPYIIGTQDLVIEDDMRPLEITIWYPADNSAGEGVNTTYQYGLFVADGNAIRDAPPLEQDVPYPLVIFSHGNGGFRFQSLFLTEHLASQGFVVLALDHPTNSLGDRLLNEQGFYENLAPNFAYRPNDVIRAIEFARDLGEFVDTSRVGVIGHSFGGYTALAAGGHKLNFDALATWCATQIPNPLENVCFLLDEQDEIANAASLSPNLAGAWPGIEDDRIQAVVSLAPWNGSILDPGTLTANPTPTLIMVGEDDTVAPPSRDGTYIYYSLFNATPKALVTFQLGGHNLFIDSCSEIAVRAELYDACSEQVWDKERAHDLINHFTTGFLQSVLNKDENATHIFDTEASQFPGVHYIAATKSVDILVPEVISERLHDTSAYTQGLLLHNGLFYESTGQRGASTLRKVDPATGEVLQRIQLPDQYFGEGLALVDDTLIQLTWQSGMAFYFDLETFEFQQGFRYTGEGWGLCYDGELLYMSDGSSTLFQRDPITFEVVGQIPVAIRGEPVMRLNELECVGDNIYANVWQTNYIMRIDKTTGEVTARIDASGLLTDEEQAELGSGEVLNGIAYDLADDVFYVTGKHWPTLFEVRFIEPES